MAEDLIKVLSFIPWFILVVGVIGNLCAFLIFTFNKNMNRMSSMTYLSFISVADTFSLFIWNLDHFFLPNYAFKIENLGVYSCKILSFIQFTSLQLSGLLHGFLSIDRYFTITSRPGSNQMPFGHPRNAKYWSLCLAAFTGLINLHLLIFNGYWEYDLFAYSNKTNTYTMTRLKKELSVDVTNFLCYYAESYDIAPMWNRVHMIFYNFLPFIFMIIFNSLLIKRTFYTKNNRRINDINSLRRKRLTISLLFITFAFIVMTLPGTIIYGFFFDFFFSFKAGHAIAMLADFLMFFQHSSIFFSCFLSNSKFRKIVIKDIMRVKRTIRKFKGQKSYRSSDLTETRFTDVNNTGRIKLVAL